jgi:tetratricopeptide (TPR) repeat protein
MPVGNVLRLQDYRDRRSSRLQLAQALHRADPRRQAVFDHLVEVAELAGADRAAVVWVDEHGTGLIHAHVVVDCLSSSPRRAFSQLVLREAWQLGVPSAYDAPAVPACAVPATFAVALGSDGVRAWFVVADSSVPRPALASETRDQIMFLAGECAAVVLHGDLDAVRNDQASAVAGPSFAGWDILADLEGRESDEAESRRIAQRFVVVRLVRLLVDEDLTVSRERTVEQVRRARAEIAVDDTQGPEGDLWCRTLDALEDERLEDLATALVDLGDRVEAQGHTHGALEIYKCAYLIAAGIGAARPAAQAARLSGRLVRRRADWSESRRWFEIALEVAEVGGLHDVEAQVLVGLAGISKETGNLPAARKGFERALSRAESSGDPDTIAFVHHGLLGLEQAAGNLAVGVQHGWVGVGMYQSRSQRLRCLASLAGALMEYGDRDAAEDAWAVVASSCEEKYYQIFAHDALGHLAALKGDRRSFEAQAQVCDALDWESGPASAKAQLLYYRGLSYRELGELELARSWLNRAAAFAEENHYNQILFRAEEAAGSLRADDSCAEVPHQPAAPREIRDGLRAMRQELVGSGV